MKVLGIIPGRAGSKRLPGKNRRVLAGKPMVSWVLEAALRATRLDRVVVSSDDERILSIAASYDDRLPLRRPPELAQDSSRPIEYVKHALSEIETRGEGAFDAVAILQPSSPLTIASDIDGTIDLLKQTGAETAVTVVQVQHALHPVKFKRMDGTLLLPYFEAEQGRLMAQDLPDVFVRNGSVYVTKRQVIEQGTVISDDSRGYVMPAERSVDINDEMDLRVAALLFSQFPTNTVSHAGTNRG